MTLTRLRRHARVRCAAIAVLFGVSCAGPPRADVAPVRGSLPAGVVARIGDVEIAGAVVGRIAATQEVALAVARDAAVRDVLLADEARARGFERRTDVSLAVEAALAHRLLRGVAADAEAAGPVTDAELADATEKHWLDLDRPDAFRTAHVLVRVSADADPPKRKAAEDVAAAIRRALEPVASMAVNVPFAPRATPLPTPNDAEDPTLSPMKLAANTVSHAGFEVIVEALPAITAAGRVVEPSVEMFDPTFAHAAAELAKRGDLSQPITSPFGVHVIMLLEKIPGQVAPLEERRALAIASREQAAEAKLIASLRRDVSLDVSVDGLLAKVAVEP